MFAKAWKPDDMSDKELYNAILIKYNNLSAEQLSVLETAYEKAKSYGLENSSRAIVFQESFVGSYILTTSPVIRNNKLHSMDCSVYHVNTRVVLNELKKKITRYAQLNMCKILNEDKEFAFHSHVRNLEYWVNYHKKKNNFTWKRVWGSYRAGFNFNGSQGKHYARMIKLIVKVIKENERHH